MLDITNPLPYNIKDSDIRGSKSNKFSKITKISSCIMSAQSYFRESMRYNPSFPLRSKEALVKPQDARKEMLDIL